MAPGWSWDSNTACLASEFVLLIAKIHQLIGMYRIFSFSNVFCICAQKAIWYIFIQKWRKIKTCLDVICQKSIYSAFIFIKHFPGCECPISASRLLTQIPRRSETQWELSANTASPQGDCCRPAHLQRWPQAAYKLSRLRTTRHCWAKR